MNGNTSVSELDTFRAETAAWLEASCPAAMRTPITGPEMLWSSSHNVFTSEAQRLWFERARDRGWFAPGWPREYGGAGLSTPQQRVLDEEMLRLGCRQPQYNLGIWMLGPVLLELGSDEQKREHLRPMARGERRWCQGFSEPNAGSDLASLRTSAVAGSDGDGEHFIVNGQKIWTSDGHLSDWMYALVRTDPQAKKQQGISFVLIDMKAPGVSVRPIELISGKSAFCEVFFDNVRVPRRQLVGGLNQGWSVAKKLLEHERAAMSKFSEGGAPSHDPLAVAAGYLDAAEPVWRDRLAGAMMDQRAFALTMRRMHEMLQAREDVSGVASIMKLVQTEQEVAKYELLQQIMGQRGLSWEGDAFSTDEHDICRLWLYTKTYTIGGGTSEIQLNLIAQRVLGLPK